MITAVNGGIAGVDSLAGGYLAQNFGFASVFWAMARRRRPRARLVMLPSPRVEGESTEPDGLAGRGLLVVSVGALLIALNEAGKLAAANWLLIAVLVVVSAVAFALFWRIENRSGHPWSTPGTCEQRATWAPLLTTVLTMTGVFAVMNGLFPALRAGRPGRVSA